jgi:hypothetical protein
MPVTHASQALRAGGVGPWAHTFPVSCDFRQVCLDTATNEESAVILLHCACVQAGRVVGQTTAAAAMVFTQISMQSTPRVSRDCMACCRAESKDLPDQDCARPELTMFDASSASGTTPSCSPPPSAPSSPPVSSSPSASWQVWRVPVQSIPFATMASCSCTITSGTKLNSIGKKLRHPGWCVRDPSSQSTHQCGFDIELYRMMVRVHTSHFPASTCPALFQKTCPGLGLGLWQVLGRRHIRLGAPS